MNVGGGEAADQMVRMMLSGGEVAVRLSGSALKNMLAISLALAKSRRTLSGRVRMGKMLRETRDLRVFPMPAEKYRQFQKLASRQKLLYSAIRGQDGGSKVVDVILPVTELDRANVIFQRMLYQPEREAQRESPAKEQERTASEPPKKESRWGRGWRDTGERSPGRSGSGGTPEKDDRPSVLDRLKGYREQLEHQRRRAPAREKNRSQAKVK